MVHIVDDFLPANLHAQLQNLMMGYEFPWHFSRAVSHKQDKGQYYFVHNVYGCSETDRSYDAPGIVESRYFEKMEAIIHFIEEKLKFQTHRLLRIRCNMYTNQNINVAHDQHVDHQQPHMTAIYYLNTNNGPTTIGDEDVESVANRLVLFDGLIEHNSNLQTDVPQRVNININMIGKFLST